MLETEANNRESCHKPVLGRQKAETKEKQVITEAAA